MFKVVGLKVTAGKRTVRRLMFEVVPLLEGSATP